MREIKFRGKRCIDKEWVYGYYVHRTDAHDISHKIYDQKTGGWHQVIPESIGQYVGETDKNGDKVYEGHMIEAYACGESAGIFEIKYMEHGFSMFQKGDTHSLDCLWYYDFKIIGNKRIKHVNKGKKKQ